MRDLVVELGGYRLFPQHAPLRLDLSATPIAIFGPNRSGKAAALKWAYELRQAFATAPGLLASGGTADLEWPYPVRGNSDIYCMADQDPVIAVTVRRKVGDAALGALRLVPVPDEPNRARLSVDADLASADAALAFQTLAGARFYGAFRSALNIDADLRYFDLNGDSAFRVSPDWPAVVATCQRLSTLFDTFVQPMRTGDDLDGLHVSGRDFRWPHFASGLTQFFALFYDITSRRAPYALVEEPELHLDGVRRRAFVEVLQELTTHGVVFATHDPVLAASATRTIDL